MFSTILLFTACFRYNVESVLGQYVSYVQADKVYRTKNHLKKLKKGKLYETLFDLKTN